jgi:hypothetical protein
VPPVIPIVVIDPANYRWVQDVDTQHPIRQFLPGLVKRIGLPEKLKYELVRPATRRALPDTQTLAQAAIKAREALWLHPVRDSLLSDLLDDLYDKAAEAIKDALWDKAQELLEQQFRLDPRYPDAQGLHKALNAQGRFVGRGPQGQGLQVSTQGFAGQGPAGQGIQQAAPVPKRAGPSLGCILLGVLGGGATLLALGLVAVVVVGYFLLQAEPALGTGDVQVTLRWDGPADLDLHVVDPFGEEIWYSHATSLSGGELDVDAHVACVPNAPVENVYWPTGGAPSGSYQVYVQNFAGCSGGASSYTVTIRVDGVVVAERSGVLAGEGASDLVAEFSYP